MDPLQIDEEQILQNFDLAVANGRAFYKPPTSTISITDKGYSFEFLISASLAIKPPAAEDSGNPSSARTTTNLRGKVLKNNSLITNGRTVASDIDIDGLEIAPILGTHLFTFNMFCVLRPQFLLLTLDPSRRQFEPLDKEDLAAAWTVMIALNTPYFVIFNCGKDGGCSRDHKHLQLIPRPRPRSGLQLFPDLQGADWKAVPFQFFLEALNPPLIKESGIAKHLENVYARLLGQAREALRLGADSFVPHNLVLVREWMMVIPRRASNFEGAYANTLGMMGLVWVEKEEDIEVWRKAGPARVLQRIGLPAEGV